MKGEKIKCETSNQKEFLSWVPAIGSRIFDHFIVKRIDITVEGGPLAKETRFIYVA